VHKASSTGSSETSILSSIFVPSTPTWLRSSSHRRRNRHAQNSSVPSEQLCCYRKKGEFCISSVSLRSFLSSASPFYTESWKSRKRTNRAVARCENCLQPVEWGWCGSPRKRLWPGKSRALNANRKNDHEAFTSKFLTKLIDPHMEHRLKPINKQCFSDESFRCDSNLIVMALE
jgi:hypothetical protein